jgi:hypothetical protein
MGEYRALIVATHNDRGAALGAAVEIVIETPRAMGRSAANSIKIRSTTEGAIVYTKSHDPGGANHFGLFEQARNSTTGWVPVDKGPEAELRLNVYDQCFGPTADCRCQLSNSARVSAGEDS